MEQLSIFASGTYNHKPNLKKGDKVVISASRRTDMVKWYPADMLAVLNNRYTPDKVHTIVIWTKHAGAVLEAKMRKALENYSNLYIHLTCTGMGGTKFEPLAPSVEETFSLLPALTDFAGGPEHIRLRVDPIFRTQISGEEFCNLQAIKEIIARGEKQGIKHYSTSFISHYPKVRKRLESSGYGVREFSPEEQKRIYGELLNYCEELGVKLDACAVPGFSESKCIDAQTLTRLHPEKLPCSSFEPRSRELCGCTHSIDIGGFYTKRCYTGCLYCYANSAAY